MKRKIPLEINGMRFSVIGDDDETYVKMIAHMVEEQIRRVKEKAPGVSPMQALTLAAFNLADESYRTKDPGADGATGEKGSQASDERWVAMVDALKAEKEELLEQVAERDRKLRDKAVEMNGLKEQLAALDELPRLKQRNEQLLNRQLEETRALQELQREHESLKQAYQALESRDDHEA